MSWVINFSLGDLWMCLTLILNPIFARGYNGPTICVCLFSSSARTLETPSRCFVCNNELTKWLNILLPIFQMQQFSKMSQPLIFLLHLSLSLYRGVPLFWLNWYIICFLFVCVLWPLIDSNYHKLVRSAKATIHFWKVATLRYGSTILWAIWFHLCFLVFDFHI